MQKIFLLNYQSHFLKFDQKKDIMVILIFLILLFRILEKEKNVFWVIKNLTEKFYFFLIKENFFSAPIDKRK